MIHKMANFLHFVYTSIVAVEIGDTSEEALNINGTTTESVGETEPAENAENTEKMVNTIKVSEIFLLLLWKICRLIVISATKQTLLKRG